MKENVWKIFDMLGVEPNENFRVDNGVYNYHTTYYIDKYLNVFDYKGEKCLIVLQHLLNGTYKIVKLPKEPKKKKLRDLTEEEYGNWQENNCKNKCSKCIFYCVACSNWINHKDLYSDKFLDQEIEVGE